MSQKNSRFFGKIGVYRRALEIRESAFPTLIKRGAMRKMRKRID
jgi:hypothetical protein